MSLNGQTYEKKQRPIPPQGLQLAVCYAIVDLGTHAISYNNQPAKPTSLVQFSWEFVNLPHQVFNEEKGPQPLAIFQKYTTSLGDKAKLGKMLQSWRGRPVENLATDLPIFLGQPCYINVEYKRDKQKPEIIYANVAMNGLGVNPIPAGTPVGPLTNPKIFFNLDSYSHAEFIKLPNFIQKEIQSSQEWSGIVARFGQPPQLPQTQQQGMPQNTGFQQQGFQQQPQYNHQQQPQYNQQQYPQNNQPVQNQGFITTPVNTPVQNQGFQTTYTVQNPQTQGSGGGAFGGEIIKGNPFDTNQPPF